MIFQNSTIEINGQSYTRKDFINEVHPVRGFVVNEMNSLVRGYVIDGYTYYRYLLKIMSANLIELKLFTYVSDHFILQEFLRNY